MHTIFTRVRQNWKSGLTVSLVSIPLSVSLAVASQSTPTIGILTAIWAGLIAALFGGSNFNIVGPTGALSGVLATYAIAHGQSSLALLAIVAGGFILLAYLGNLQRFLVFVPASAMHGFTLGVAIIIALGQLNFATGISGLATHERFVENLLESLRHLGSGSWTTFVVFLFFLVGLFILQRLVPKIPGAVLLAPIGILFGYLTANGTIPLTIQTLGQKFSNLHAVLFIPPHWQWDEQLLIGGFTVAVVAILETMLSAKIADGMTKTKHDERKEMRGLALANIAVGLMGGIPATAALARTSLNIKSGADHRVSAGISSVCIALISLVFLRSFSYIPLAVIAAILVFVAIRMVEGEHFVRMFRRDKLSFGISLLVALVTVYLDPIVGILFGTAITLMIFIERLSHGQFDLIINDAERKDFKKATSDDITNIPEHAQTLVYSIKGQLAFINGRAHLERLSKLNGYKHIVLRLRELYFIDLDGVDILDEIIEGIHAQGKDVLISSVSPFIQKHLEESKGFRLLEKQQLVFHRTEAALKHLGY